MRRTDALPDWPTGPLPTVRVAAAVPAPADYRARISRARDQLDGPGQPAAQGGAGPRPAAGRRCSAGRSHHPAPAGRRRPDRLRLSRRPDRRRRRLRGGGPGGRQPRTAGRALRRSRRCADRSPARRHAPPTPTSTPPTAPHWPHSAKDRHEHQLVIDTMRAALEPLCDDLTIASEPQLSRTAAVWHLCTPISGRLRDTSTTAIDLALALHPTPAVGGVPTRAPHPSSSPSWKVTAVSTPGRWAGATPAATVAGWCPSAARSCRPTAAPRSRAPAAASSPNPIPMTKSTRRQRNSPRY